MISFRGLTARRASDRIARVKSLCAFCLLLACVSCTTLENRRDLYRSPAEGYEEWYPHPPPTRLPSTGPATKITTTPHHARRDQFPGGITESASAYANGMFILIRATSVWCTTADFAMWRFSFPLLEESKCRREAC